MFQIIQSFIKSENTMDRKKVREIEKKIMKYIARNFQDGDWFVVYDAAFAICKCEELQKRIDSEGDLVNGTNGIPYRHPLYALLKDFKNEKRELLRELGLTPYARKRLTGTSESDGAVEDARTGRRKSKSKLEAERAAEAESEFAG